MSKKVNEAIEIRNGKKRIIWDIVLNDFLTHNLTMAREAVKPGEALGFDLKKMMKEGYTFKSVAKKFGLNYDYVRAKGSKGRWYDRLCSKIAEINEKAAKVVQDVTEQTEEKIRMRHAVIARLALSKGAIYLQNLDADKLTPAEAIKLIDLGYNMERKAVGIPDKMTLKHDFENADFQTVAEHIESHNEKMKLLGVIAELMRQNKMLKETDVVDV